MTTSIERTTALSVPPPDALAILEERHSKLLEFLPAMYAGDAFLNRFLMIFEDTLTPLQQMADNLFYYFHPFTTPPELLNWLASWVNLVLDDSWPIELRRQLIHNAVELYSRRGTKRGLTEYLKLYSGVQPEITEYVDGMTLSPETLLGINTTIAGRERHSFTVTLRLSGMTPEQKNSMETTLRRIIDAEKPAHTAYRLVILTDEGKGKKGGGSKPKDGGDKPAANPKIEDSPTVTPKVEHSAQGNVVGQIEPNGKKGNTKPTGKDIEPNLNKDNTNGGTGAE
jgi:phage tail-like protein